MPRPLITENDVLFAARSGKKELRAPSNAIITPLARDSAKTLGVRFVSEPTEPPALPANDLLTIAIGSDHAGFHAKTELKTFLAAQGYRVFDVGADSDRRCDYPDFAEKVGEALRTGRATFGVMIDGAGTASAVVLNKIPSVRAASCESEWTARIARAHGNANALTLGARGLGIDAMKAIAQTFLTTVFEGGRHQERLDKIQAIEQRHFRR